MHARGGRKGIGGAGARAGLLLSMAFFGTIGVFVRHIPLPSGLIALCRGVIGTLFLLLLMAAKKSPPSWADIRRNLLALCLSGAALGINWVLLFEAYRRTTVATATLCYYMAPVFVILLSPLVCKERLTPRKLVLAAAAVAGMVLVSGALQPGAGGASVSGVLLGVGAAVMYAGVVLLNKRLSGVSPYDATVVQLGVSAAVLLPYTLIAETVAGAAFTPLAAVLLLTVGVLHTGVAYALYFGSIRSLKAQTVAIFSYLDPVVAIVLSALLLGERMSTAGVLGAVLILGGTLLNELTEARTSPDGLELRRLRGRQIRRWYAVELAEAFPEQERKPLSDILALRRANRYDIWGLFEAGDGKAPPLGYATVLRARGVSCVLLDYLGVTASRRGEGLGSRILELLAARYPNRRIVAESELPACDAAPEENALRRRRIAFYARNGFRPVYEMATCGLRWQAMASTPAPEPDSDDMRRLMAEHAGLYGEKRTDVRIPLPPGEAPAPPYWMRGE